MEYLSVMKKKKMHYRLWVLYGRREKLVFRFSRKDRHHCGLARTTTITGVFSLKSMMLGTKN